MATSNSDCEYVLTTDNPQAEILLVDSGFKVVAHGPSPLQGRAAPGFYAMKTRIGDQENEVLLTLDVPSGHAVEQYLLSPEFESPIPLTSTSTDHPEQRQKINQVLKQENEAQGLVVIGEGAYAVISIRDPSSMYNAISDSENPEKAQALYAGSFTGFRVLDSAGEILLDIHEQGVLNLDIGFLGIAIRLNPGWYCFAHRRGNEWICVPIHAVPGWTFQVYVNLVRSGSDPFTLVPDLSNMAVIFDRSCVGGLYDGRDDLIVSETIRKGLLDGRNYADTPTMRSLFRGKFENPMLGLYAAHLLLLEPHPSADLLDEVVRNTGAMLGNDFPDVIALRWAFSQRFGEHAFIHPSEYEIAAQLKSLQAPPILIRSWDLLLDAAERTSPKENSLPVFSIAGNLLAHGVYLTWREPSSLSSGKELAIAPRRPTGLLPDVARFLSRKALDAISTVIPLSLVGEVDIASLIIQAWKSKVGGPDLSSRISEVRNADDAAKLMRTLADQVNWAEVLTWLRQNRPEWLAQLNGFQRDLLLTLRDASINDAVSESITGHFVKRLMANHRLPLSTLLEGFERAAALIVAVSSLIEDSSKSSDKANPAEP